MRFDGKSSKVSILSQRSKKNSARTEVRPYKHSDFEQIATAIGIAVKPIADLEAQFEAAALWFRLDRKQAKRIAPSKRREKLNQVAKSARRLLKSLGIDDPDEAVDGNGDPEILEALVLIGEPDANPMVHMANRTPGGDSRRRALLQQPSSITGLTTSGSRGCQATGQTNI